VHLNFLVSFVRKLVTSDFELNDLLIKANMDHTYLKQLPVCK